MNLTTGSEPTHVLPHDASGSPDFELPDVVLPPQPPWPEAGYRPARYAKSGLMLGTLAGCTSLIVNVIGSLAWTVFGGEALHPLRIIQVYLTFPFGQQALRLDGGAVLALGCLLYLVTGMFYGILFELTSSYYLPHAGVRARLVSYSVLALIVWLINFYGLLIWLQPLLLGGRWIVDLIPWWVGAVTHLVFGWTMALVYPFAASDRSVATAHR
ncbi:MAG: hypothetical protein WD738_13310 [Pirellulales bacterium]